MTRRLPVALRCCLLSGGACRRMGRDKALLPHPERGTWIEHTLRQLAVLQAPITVLSRHCAHLELAQRFGRHQGMPVEAVDEPPPWEGPLLALQLLLAVIPPDPALALDLAQAVAQGQRRLQGWVLRRSHRLVVLPVDALCNINAPQELSAVGLLPASAPALDQS